MTIPWFKFYGADYLADPKMLALTACERSCWITLLAYASQSNGEIKFLNESLLISQSGIEINSDDWNKTIGVLQKFVKLEMIQIETQNETQMITIKNWVKRQELSLNSYERVKKWRKMKQNETQMIRNETQNDNAREEKSRVEKIKEENNVSSFKKNVTAYKKKNRYYKATGEIMRFSQNKWWVIPKHGGDWLLFAGRLEIDSEVR